MLGCLDQEKEGVRHDFQLPVLKDWVDNDVRIIKSFTQRIIGNIPHCQQNIHVLFPTLYSLAFQDQFICGHVEFEQPGDVWEALESCQGSCVGKRVVVYSMVEWRLRSSFEDS